MKKRAHETEPPELNLIPSARLPRSCIIGGPRKRSEKKHAGLQAAVSRSPARALQWTNAFALRK